MTEGWEWRRDGNGAGRGGEGAMGGARGEGRGETGEGRGEWEFGGFLAARGGTCETIAPMIQSTGVSVARSGIWQGLPIMAIRWNVRFDCQRRLIMVVPNSAVASLGTETAFEVLARANALAAQGRSIVNLGIGQPDFATPAHIVEAGRQALADGRHGYTPAAGIPELRDAVARDLERRHGESVDPGAVLITPGRQARDVLHDPDDGRAGRRDPLPQPGLSDLRYR